MENVLNEEAFKAEAEDEFIDDEAVLKARDAFGIKYLYPWQRLVVANILDAFEESQKREEEEAEESDLKSMAHQIVLLPTGAGKSLCFQVPALLLPGPTLIIYPLLALMSDQERRMNEGSLKCVVFKGGQTIEERNSNFEKIKKGEARVIIANPEILCSEAITDELRKCGISHIAIDEAHCVSEYGDTFRKSYLELGKIIKRIGAPVVTAFTATASPEVLERVSEILFDGNAHIVRSESDRPNIRYYVKKCASKKKAVLYLSRSEKKPMIVFCGSRRKTEDLSRELNFAYGEETSRFYHAGLSREEKKVIEKWFFDKKDAVLVATCAFGMGVDKSDIRTVIHYDVPFTAESYIQEAGRGGRDRERADAILLWNDEDEKKTKDYVKGTRKAAMRSFALSESCRRQVLLDALGAEQAVCSGCDLCENRQNQEKKIIWRNKNLSVRNPFKKTLFRLSEKAGFMTFEGTVNFIHQPGEKLPEAEEIMLKLVKKYDRYFTKETLEERFTDLMNQLCIPVTGICIWDNSGFETVWNSLLEKKRVRILKFPWKNRIAFCEAENYLAGAAGAADADASPAGAAPSAGA